MAETQALSTHSVERAAPVQREVDDGEARQTYM